MTDVAAPPPFALDAHAELEAFTGDKLVGTLVKRGAVVVIGFFVVLGGWASVAPLDSAAVSYGVVQTETSRKTVQHAEGGVVAAVLVKDGDLVRQGQELVRLDQTQARAGAQINTAAVDSLTAAIARLEAEQAGAPAVAFPSSLTSRAADLGVAAVMASQVKLFEARRASISGAGGTLAQQVAQSQSQASGYASEVAGIDKQYDLIQDELAGLKKLYDQGYATKPRLLAMERAAAALIAQKQDYQANMQRLKYAAAQTTQQIAQLQRDRLAGVSAELSDARAKLADAVERQGAAQAVLDHTVIRAPTDGLVLGLNLGVGTVVGRGEPLFQVIPTDNSSLVAAHLKPGDGAHVKKGMKVELRVSSAEGRRLPMLHGTVQSRSADLLTDARSGSPFYDLKVKVEPGDVKLLSDAGLGVGAPMQVIVPTGSRTALQYIFEPVADSFRRGLRER